VAERPSIQQCNARRMFCIRSPRRAVGAEGWHAGAWVDESTTANLVEQTKASNDRPSAAHPSSEHLDKVHFPKNAAMSCMGVSHGPNARCGSARGHRGRGRKLSRVLSFVHHANRPSVYLSVCLSVCPSVWPGQLDADRINVFCTCATLMGLQRRCAGKLVSLSQLRRSIFGD
jgi:hypothetical protein